MRATPSRRSPHRRGRRAPFGRSWRSSRAWRAEAPSCWSWRTRTGATRPRSSCSTGWSSASRRCRFSLVVTFRPEFGPPWVGHAHVTSLALSRLGRAEAGAIADEVAGGRELPAELLDTIVARTDGVPLFVEELTKAVLEGGLLRPEGDRYVLRARCHP